jgi:hypothetical protein
MPAPATTPPRPLGQFGVKIDQTLVLTVINNGSDPITVKTIGFTKADGGDGDGIDFLETWRNRGIAALPTSLGTEALLPDRIEGHDCRIYEYSADALKKLPAGEYRGYAERYKSFRIWPKGSRSTVRTSVSKGTVSRQQPAAEEPAAEESSQT